MSNAEESPNRALRRKRKSVLIVPKKRKVNKIEENVKDIYLQKNFTAIGFKGNSLETIYENPKSRKASISFMGSLKLRRYIKFTPYLPPEHKIKHRRKKSTIVKRLSKEADKVSSKEILKHKVGYTESKSEGNISPTECKSDKNMCFTECRTEENIRSTEYKIEENIPFLDNNLSLFNLKSRNYSPISSIIESGSNFNSITSNLSSNLVLSETVPGERENVISDDIFNVHPPFDNFMLVKTVDKAKKKRRTSKQFLNTAFMEISQNNIENKINNSCIQQPCDKVPENIESSEILLKSVGSLKRIIIDNEDIQSINFDFEKCKENMSISVPHVQSKHRNRRSRGVYMSSTDFNKLLCQNDDSKSSQDITDPDGNMSLSSTLLSELSLFSPKKVNQRRRSARLSMSDKKSISTLGSLWLDK